MGQMITKPDVNPIIIAVAQWFGFGALGYYLMGQQKKAMYAAGIVFALFVLSVCTLGIGSIALPIAAVIFIYDGYLVAQKLASGQAVGENENGLEFLNAVFKD